MLEGEGRLEIFKGGSTDAVVGDLFTTSGGFSICGVSTVILGEVGFLAILGGVLGFGKTVDFVDLVVSVEVKLSLIALLGMGSATGISLSSMLFPDRTFSMHSSILFKDLWYLNWNSICGQEKESDIKHANYFKWHLRKSNKNMHLLTFGALSDADLIKAL